MSGFIRMFKGAEIRKLVLVSTLCCVLLIASVSLYLMISSRNNLKEQTHQMKLAMAGQIADHIQGCYASMEEFFKQTGIDFGSTLRDPANTKAVTFYTDSFQKAYDADFVIYYAADGRVVSRARDESMAIPDLPRGIAGGEEYVVMNELGGREGSFLVLDKEGIIPGDEAIIVIDNTEQNEILKQAYDEEKSSQIKEQIIWVAVIFLLFLALSFFIIRFSITRLLERPISRLSKEARDILKGESEAEEEVHEKSIFANLQRLVNSGRVILAKAGGESVTEAESDTAAQKRETNQVIAVWALVTTIIFLVATVALLVTSIVLVNNKTDAILDNVNREMAGYWSGANDSIIDYAWSHPSVYIGKELWDPNVEMDRLQVIERLVEMIRYTYNCDSTVAFIRDPATGEGRYFTSVKEGEELKQPLPSEMGAPVTIYEDYYTEGDLVIVLENRTAYPGFGSDQFDYFVVDVTPQADVLGDLYESGSSSLLTSQLWLSLLFLALCLLLSPLAMAWATRRFITRPIIELDGISARLMEGELDEEIVVDEKSSFADIQRLLKRAQEVLRSMA